MQYRISKAGDSGLLHVEEEDVLSARPITRDPDGNAVELTLRRRSSYLQQDGFRFHGAESKTCSLRLTVRQVKDLVEQDAAQQETFCSPCYWYGNSPDPETCTRCRIAEAFRRGGHGDLRKVKAFIPPPDRSLVWIFLLALLSFAVLLAAGSAERAGKERDQAREELQQLRRQLPHSKQSEQVKSR